MSESADCQATLHASHSPQSLRPSRRTSVRSLVCRVGSRFLRTGALTTCRMTRASENLQRADLTDTLSRGRCLTCGVPAGRSTIGTAGTPGQVADEWKSAQCWERQRPRHCASHLGRGCAGARRRVVRCARLGVPDGRAVRGSAAGSTAVIGRSSRGPVPASGQAAARRLRCRPGQSPRITGTARTPIWS
jgi:hypothetical protein